MKFLGVDFETQDEDARTTNVTEVGALLVDENFKELWQLSQLCYELGYPAQTQKIEKLTGISDAMLKAEGRPRKQTFEALAAVIDTVDYVFAHNKSFDEVVFFSTCEKLGVSPPRTPWICTVTEVDYPAEITCKKLSHLAFEYGVPVDQENLHRALDDVRLMFEVLKKFPLVDVINFAKEPWVYFQALFPAPFESKIGFELGRTKASKMKFSWERARGDEREFPKKWVKRVKKRFVPEVEAEAERLGLAIKVIA